MTYALSDNAYLEAHPRASLTIRTEPCGKGIAQPGWPACNAPAVWEIAHPWGTRYAAAYCTEHAARRLRGADHLRALSAAGGKA